MGILIHATVRVTGDAALLPEFDHRLQALLEAHAADARLDPQHGPAALFYSMMVEDGIPFPPFVAAAEEFPDLTVSVEWVNAVDNAQGAVSFVNGKLARQDIAPLSGVSAAGGNAVYVAAARDGTIRLAATFFRAGPDEYRGYAMSATRDAVFRMTRPNGEDRIELHVTDGSPEWAVRWTGDLTDGLFDAAPIAPPQPVDDGVYRELEQLAHEFIAEWVWLESAPETEIAIERARYAQRGDPVHDANLKSVRLHRMRQQAQEAQEANEDLAFRAGAADDLWVAEVLLASWAAAG